MRWNANGKKDANDFLILSSFPSAVNFFFTTTFLSLLALLVIFADCSVSRPGLNEQEGKIQ